LKKKELSRQKKPQGNKPPFEVPAYLTGRVAGQRKIWQIEKMNEGGRKGGGVWYTGGPLKVGGGDWRWSPDRDSLKGGKLVDGRRGGVRRKKKSDLKRPTPKDKYNSQLNYRCFEEKKKGGGQGNAPSKPNTKLKARG